MRLDAGGGATQAEPTLRYFDARGRAQFIRYYFRARELAFVDERIPLSADFAAWRELQPDRSKTGPFQRLPVLEWGDGLVAETLVIASFVHAAMGDAERLPAAENLRHETLVSSLYNDVMLPVGTLLWADLAYPGIDVPAMARRTLERLSGYLTALEKTLGEWRWLEQAAERPVLLGDCLLWEELDVLKSVFGDLAGVDERPALAHWHREAPSRAAFAECLEAVPCQITAHPNEAGAIATIRAALA
jgi:glutathione S-transferase